ncbi:MAG: hypothetical protein ACYC66_07345 [Chloroflexota bacterium]
MSEKLTAGPELDRLVHTRVVGAEGAAPAYSTDIAVAWDLWKKLPRPKRLHVDAERVHHCMCGGSEQGAAGSFEPEVWERADKMALVICMAALKWAERGRG